MRGSTAPLRPRVFLVFSLLALFALSLLPPSHAQTCTVSGPVNTYQIDTSTTSWSSFTTLSYWSIGLNNASSTSIILTDGVAADHGIYKLANDLTVGQIYTTQRVPLQSNKAFSTFFSFKITNPKGVNDVSPSGNNAPGGDGLIFVLQTISNNPIGNTPSLYRLAFNTLPNSFGVEFDTFYNGSPEDSDGNHVGINTEGVLNSKQRASNPVLWNNGQTWYAWVDYDGTTVSVLYSPTAIRPIGGALTFSVHLEGIFGTATNPFAGFGAAVGAAGNKHEILEWKFRTSFNPIIVACPNGQYPNGACTSCPAGTYSNQTANRCCYGCPAGTFSGQGATTCQACPAGQFSVNPSSSCQACSCVRGSCEASTGNCVCEPGFALPNCDTCLPFHFGENCLPCPDCKAGVCEVGGDGNGTCVCNDGYLKDEEGSCTLCLPGHGGPFCLPCTANCSSCPSSSSLCDECENGTFLNNGKCVETCPEGLEPVGKICTGSCFIQPESTSFELTDFDSPTASVSFGGEAVFQNPSGNGNPLVLSAGLGSGGIPVSGTAFTSSPIDFDDQYSFSTFFSFIIGTPLGVTETGEGRRGGEGFALILLSSSSVPASAPNTTFGLRGLTGSMAVEFDTFKDMGDSDPNGNHVGINLGGNLTSVATQNISLSTLLNNGNQWFAWVDYDGVTDRLEIRLSQNDTRPDSPLISHVVDLADLFLQAPLYPGFGASVGTGGNTHMVTEWKFRSLYLPYDILCGGGHFFNGSGCEACGRGYYQSEEFSTCCVACEAGTFANVTGLASCFECAEGEFSAPQSSGCFACLCQNGVCDQRSGICQSCDEGFTGELCNTCAPGYFGPLCEKCPSCGAGVCLDGDGGNGTCVCQAGYRQDVNGSCTECAQGFGGSNCLRCFDTRCSSCPARTTLCEECLAGNYFFGSTCVEQCPERHFVNGTVCSRCSVNCRTCVDGTREGCLSCTEERVLNVTSELSQTGSCACANGTLPVVNPIQREVELEGCFACSNNCSFMGCRDFPEICTGCNEGAMLSGTVCVNVTEVPTNGPTDKPADEPTDAPTGGPSTLYISLGVGIPVVLLLCIALVLLFVIIKRSNKKKARATESSNAIMMAARNYRRNSAEGVDSTMLNTHLEVAIPGFLHLNLHEQVRTEAAFGRGGSGVIFKGVLLDPVLIQRHQVSDVAVKVIPDAEGLSNEEVMQGFHREVAIMWSLSFHPNIITLIGFCNEPRTLVTKMYERDLSSYLHHRTKGEEITHRQKELLLTDIVNGVVAIHEMNIAHRDLKASNILIETQLHDGMEVKKAVICDFGLAFVGEADRAVQSLVKEIHINGFSPRYAAPEVFARSHIPTSSVILDLMQEKSSDVYALGVIFWEVLTERIPWEKMPLEEIESRVRQGQRPSPPPRPVAAEDEKSVALLSAIMEHSWNQNAKERPTSNDIHSKMTLLAPS